MKESSKHSACSSRTSHFLSLSPSASQDTSLHPPFPQHPLLLSISSAGSRTAFSSSACGEVCPFYKAISIAMNSTCPCGALSWVWQAPCALLRPRWWHFPQLPHPNLEAQMRSFSSAAGHRDWYIIDIKQTGTSISFKHNQVLYTTVSSRVATKKVDSDDGKGKDRLPGKQSSGFKTDYFAVRSYFQENMA